MSKRNKGYKHNENYGKETELPKAIAAQVELIEAGVKESRIDGGYSRKVEGRQRDAARRERSSLNRRKSQRNRR